MTIDFDQFLAVDMRVGRIVKVEISVGDDAYVDLEQHLAAALARD